MCNKFRNLRKLGQFIKKEFSKAKGFTLVEVMIVVSIIVLLATLAISGLLRARITANESVAQTVLKSISNACENFASSNSGNYPINIDALTLTSNPPYLQEDYTSNPRAGYNYTCDTMDNSGYTCTATPVDCSRTGTQTYTITTGGVMTAADCI